MRAATAGGGEGGAPVAPPESSGGEARSGGRVASALRGYTEQLNRRLQASRGSPVSPGGSPSVGRGGAQQDCMDQAVHTGRLDAPDRHSVPANGPSEAAAAGGGGARHGMGTVANGSTKPLEGNLESPERPLNGSVITREVPGESRSSSAAAHAVSNGNNNSSSGATYTEGRGNGGASGGAGGRGDAGGLSAAGLAEASRESFEGKAGAVQGTGILGGGIIGSRRGEAVESFAPVISNGSRVSPGVTGASSQGLQAVSSSSFMLWADGDDDEVRVQGAG